MQLAHETFDRTVSEEQSQNREETDVTQRDEDATATFVPLDPRRVCVVVEELK